MALLKQMLLTIEKKNNRNKKNQDLVDVQCTTNVQINYDEMVYSTPCGDFERIF